MASNSDLNEEPQKFYKTLKHFPTVLNGRIKVIEFLEASQDLIRVVDHLGTAVAPVKYDMQGNIDKIKKYFKYDESSCLLELMYNETAKGKPGTESVVWLNRAILFFELTFQELIGLLQENNLNVPIKKVLTVAYEGSVKKYHNWVTQQIFSLICKMAPTIPQFLKSIEADDDLEVFRTALTTFNIKVHLIRCKIDDFIKENNLYDS
ncbi:glycolipid transfer protein (GLTP) domain-containing protein [Phthorimaea operculella]|nr:glycolipid transfer protein (GLTP) domain-containing protein [Phthorimaea operculella]